MTEQTIAEDTPYGSVERYAAILRRVRRAENLDTAALGVVQAIASEPSMAAADKVLRILNVTAAADLVGDEMTARDDEQGARDAELAKLRARVTELEGFIPRASGSGPVDAVGNWPAEPSCQGAPAGFEADCGVAGPHGPHGPEPIASHYDASDLPGPPECACGSSFATKAELTGHIQAAN